MIVIYTDRDVAKSCKDVAFDDLHWSYMDVDLQVPANWSEDVYFWRNGGLRKQGHQIEKRWKETETGRRFAEYFMPKA